jgi:hypothetical protein
MAESADSASSTNASEADIREDWDELANERKGRGPHTRRAYAHVVGEFMAWCQQIVTGVHRCMSSPGSSCRHGRCRRRSQFDNRIK